MIYIIMFSMYFLLNHYTYIGVHHIIYCMSSGRPFVGTIDVMQKPERFILTPFQKFCIRWSVFFDSSSDRLSRTETVLRSIQFSTIMITSGMTMTSVLIADNKKALESFTYFVICVFMLAIITFAIRTKRFNRAMLLMVVDEFPGYNRPMPDALKHKMTAIRTSYSDFTMKVIVSYLTLVLFEIPATAMVPLAAAGLTQAKLGSQSTQMVVLWFPADTSQVNLCNKKKIVLFT